MPIIKSAKKKLRQDKKRRVVNVKQKEAVAQAIHNFKKKPTLTSQATLYSALDTTAKKNIFHPNKIARLKKRLSKLLKKKSP